MSAWSRLAARRVGVVGAIGALVFGAAFVVTAAPAGATTPSWGHAPPSRNGAVYASPDAKSKNRGNSCSNAKYTTINDAIAHAPSGGTVVACPGTYKEDVVILKPLSLIGQRATIDATGLPGSSTGAINGQALYNGISIEASHVSVQGFTVKGAEGEGILAVNPNFTAQNIGGMQLFTGSPLTNVTLRNNNVTGNDLGNEDPNSPYVFCTPNGGGDCGEGIHFMSVANSSIVQNRSAGNSGGILLTDEFGPTHDNLIWGNVVVDNVNDCGITIPSHNLGRNPATGQLLPNFGGVYRNSVVNNIVTGNGTKGFGAGIGVFAPFPGSASYDNYVAMNFAENNGLAGISVHSHAPGAYVDGNVFTKNFIGTNNVTKEDGADGPPKDTETTGILIWSAVDTYHFTVTNNHIFNNAIGIWLTPATINATGLGTNHFQNVGTPVFNAS